jgi:hypothetical protein
MTAMQDAVLQYFAGEKLGGVTAALVGGAALAAAAVLVQPRWELRAFAVALGVMGLLELAVGVGLVLRTGPQVDGLVAQLGGDAPRFFAEETARMVRVQRNFVALEVVWAATLALGAAVALTQKARPTLWGVALGLLVHASFLLVFDLVAERRGAAYLAALEAGRR